MKKLNPSRNGGVFVLSKQSITTTYTCGAADKISSPLPEAYFLKLVVNCSAKAFAF